METVETLMQNGITADFHSAQCLQECPSYMSAAEFARLAVGQTPYGVQVWCIRHNMNVYHLDVRVSLARLCHARRRDGHALCAGSHPRVLIAVALTRRQARTPRRCDAI